MFAAASGARLARKKDVKKQVSSGNLDGYQANYRALQQQHPFLKYDGPNIPSNRYGYPTRRIHYYTSTECDSALRLSSSYVEFNGRLSKLGHSDFEVCYFFFSFFHNSHFIYLFYFILFIFPIAILVLQVCPLVAQNRYFRVIFIYYFSKWLRVILKTSS